MTIHDTIQAVLYGDLPLEALGPSAAHDVAMPIYLEALRILDLPQPARRAEIERHALADLLAAEVVRLWKYRQEKACASPGSRVSCTMTPRSTY